VLVLFLAALCASAASPKRVLILDPYGRDVAPYSTAASTFRATLARDMGQPIDFYEIPLDLARFAESEGEGPLVAFLEGRIKNRPVDLVVPIGGAGVQFVERYRERLFPNTPILVVGSDPRFVSPDFLRTNATLVTQRVNLVGMVEDILQVQPQTTNIAVVFGASAPENYWVGECRREFQSFTNRVGFTWLNDLPLDQIVARCTTLPPRSFILHVLFVADAAGVPCERSEALRRLHEVANAPLFGYFASELGLGPIGGRLYQDFEVGAQGVHAGSRILRGERPENIPPKVIVTTAPVFDWRELQRWGVTEASLPPGSVIQFRQAGFWERYRWLVIGTLLFCLLQAALIIGLLVNRAKRRQGEAEASLIADISSKFVNLPPSEVDREIEDAQRRIFELLDLDVAGYWQWSAEASGFFRIRHFVRAGQGPQLPEQMNAQEYVPWLQQQVLAGRTVAMCSMSELPPEAARDRETFRQFGFKSSLTIPLSVGGEQPIGALGFNTVREERDWPDPLVKRLQLVAQVFSNALARNRADEALREGEKRFRLLVEQAPEAILVMDLEQDRLVNANDQAERLFGCNRKELLATGLQRFYAPEQPDGQPVEDSVRANNDRVLRGETVVYERTVCNALGQRLDCEVRLVRLPAGERKLVRASFIDITERRRSEAALHDLSGRLINAQEQERARVARELHDGLSQDLALQAVELELMGQRPPAEAAEITRRLQELSAQMKKLSTGVHRIAHDLHPAKLTQLGLTAAIAELCQAGFSVHRIPIAFEHNDIPRSLPLGVALCLYRVAQECIQNLVKHSGAKQAEVELRMVENEIHLRVTDDGRGFDVESKQTTSALGLVSMRERVRLVQGRISVHSHPGKGTRVEVWAPLKG
jgi:PAS domain S-box-containing protein